MAIELSDVMEHILNTSMTTGSWKELARKLVTEKPELIPWLYEALEPYQHDTSGMSSKPANTPQNANETMMMGVAEDSAIASQSDDAIHEEIMRRLDQINEDDLLSCHSNAIWTFRLMMRFGDLEKALKAAEVEKSVFLRHITEALGYDESDRFRINNYLRRYEH